MPAGSPVARRPETSTPAKNELNPPPCGGQISAIHNPVCEYFSDLEFRFQHVGEWP